jgi:hypothetical protein
MRVGLRGIPEANFMPINRGGVRGGVALLIGVILEINRSIACTESLKKIRDYSYMLT